MSNIYIKADGMRRLIKKQEEQIEWLENRLCNHDDYPLNSMEYRMLVRNTK